MSNILTSCFCGALQPNFIIYIHFKNIPHSQQNQSLMPDSEQAEPHEEDDCEDCQKERAENNQLIDFYERLNKIKEKVTKIKPTLSTHGEGTDSNHQKLSRIGQKITKPPGLELSGVDDKQMGYELAYALLEREIKIKKENALLTKRIQEMKEANIKLAKEKQAQRQASPQRGKSERNSFYISPRLTIKKGQETDLPLDSLDSAVEKEGKSKNFWGFEAPRRNNRYSDSIVRMEDTHTNTNSSSISSFQYTGRASTFRSPDPQAVTQPPKYDATSKYGNMNLWLYQYNVQDQGNIFGGLGKTKSPGRKSKY